MALPSMLNRRRGIGFDNLPDEAHVGIRDVAAVLGCGLTTIRRRVAEGRFPQPHNLLSARSVWNVGEVRAWLAEHKTAA